MSGLIQDLSFGSWLISLSVLCPGVICAVRCARNSLLVGTESCPLVWLDRIWLVRSPVHGNLSCFHISAFVNNTAVNICVQTFLRVPAFSSLVCKPGGGRAESHGNSLEMPFRSPQQLHHSAFPSTATRIPIDPHPRRHLLFSILFTVTILVSVKEYFVVFDLHFPND